MSVLSRVSPALVILAPILVYGVSSGGAWFFDLGGADNWQYVKYFTSWGDASPTLRDMLDADYKGSRIGWVAYGWLVFQLAPSYDAAQIFLTLSVFAAGCYAFYLILAETTDRSVALLFTAFAAASPLLHGTGTTAGFWNYHAGFANVFLLLGVFTFFRAARLGLPALWLVLSGACFGVALSTTLLLVNFVWALVGLGVVLLWGRPILTWVKTAALMIGGFAAAVVAQGLLNWAVGGTPLFLASQFTLFFRFLGDNVSYEYVGAWFPRARFLGFLIAGTAAIAAGTVAWPFLNARLPEAARRPTLALLLYGLLSMVGFTIPEFREQTTLQISYVQYHVLAPVLLGLAAAYRLLLRGRSDPPVVVVVVVAMALVVTPLVALTPAGRMQFAAAVAGLLHLPAGVSVVFTEAIVVSACIAAAVALARFRLGWLGLAAGIAFVEANVNLLANRYSPVASACDYSRDQFPFYAAVTDWLGEHDVMWNGVAWTPDDLAVAWKDGCPPVQANDVLWNLARSAMVRRTPVEAVTVDQIIPPGQLYRNDVTQVVLMLPAERSDAVVAEFVESVSTQHQTTARVVDSREFQAGAMTLTVTVLSLI